jgi:hypothetical protein
MASMDLLIYRIRNTSGHSRVSILAHPILQNTDTNPDNWLDSLASFDIPTCGDPNDGSCAGSYFIPSSMDPQAQTRSDARLAYHDKAAQRPNYHLMTSTRVSRIVFENKSRGQGANLNARGVGVGRTCARTTSSLIWLVR